MTTVRPIQLLRRLTSAVVRSARAHGPIGGMLAVLEHAIRRLLESEDRRWDRMHRLDVVEGVAATPIGVEGGSGAEGFAYVASPRRLIRVVLRDLPICVRDATFVDLGSGKGGAVLVAADEGFAEAVGVEFSPTLHHVAVTNAARMTARHAGLAPTRFVLADAAGFAFPPTPLVIYLNNPFSERVMGQVLANLEASLRSRPRPVVLLYQEARHEFASDRTQNLRLIAESPALRRVNLDLSVMERLVLLPWRIRRFQARCRWCRRQWPCPCVAALSFSKSS